MTLQQLLHPCRERFPSALSEKDTLLQDCSTPMYHFTFPIILQMCNELYIYIYIYRNGLQTIQMLIRSAVVDVAIRLAVLSACLHS